MNAETIMALKGVDARNAVRRCPALLVVLEVAERDPRALVHEAAWVRYRKMRKDLPVLTTCPRCAQDARTEEEVERFFGYRTIRKGTTARVYVQSQCRRCRTKKNKGE